MTTEVAGTEGVCPNVKPQPLKHVPYDPDSMAYIMVDGKKVKNPRHPAYLDRLAKRRDPFHAPVMTPETFVNYHWAEKRFLLDELPGGNKIIAGLRGMDSVNGGGIVTRRSMNMMIGETFMRECDVVVDKLYEKLCEKRDYGGQNDS